MKNESDKTDGAAIEARVAELLGQMTREEKIGQLGQVSMPAYGARAAAYAAGVRAGEWG